MTTFAHSLFVSESNNVHSGDVSISPFVLVHLNILLLHSIFTFAVDVTYNWPVN